MKSIIVTAVDKNSGKSFDVEVPADLDVLKLTDDLIQTLSGADPSLDWDIDRANLYSHRMAKYLNGENTLYDEGVWNGDYIYIIER